MNAIHKEHKQFGYITSVSYASTVDSDNKPDWIMSYEPGPKARAEYQTFTRSGRAIELSIMEAPEQGSGTPVAKPLAAPRRKPSPCQKHLRFDQPLEEAKIEEAASPVLAEMVRRGISHARATTLLATSDPGLIVDQLEWGDHQIRVSKSGDIRDPAGFYIHLIEAKILPPPSFETSTARRKNAERNDQLNLRLEQRSQLEDAYSDYCKQEIDRYMAGHITPQDLADLAKVKTAECRKEYPNLPQRTIDEMVPRSVRTVIGKRMGLLTLEEFSERERRLPRDGSSATADASWQGSEPSLFS